jgi:hypothetical protein
MNFGSVDYGDLKKLQKQLRELSGDSITLEKFYEDCAKELAARLLAKVIKRTPVGVYPPSSGKVGGTLRRGWTAGKAGNAAAYANSLHVTKEGSTYVIEITNPVKYAPYVEFGHRTANHKGWVEGQFMLTISENELQGQMSGILEKKIANFLKEHLT